MIKMKNLNLLFVLCLLLVYVSPALAGDTTCIDEVKTVVEINKCAEKIVLQGEIKAKRELKRIEKKYKKEMGEFVEVLMADWVRYKATLCSFERNLATKGQASGGPSIDEQKVFIKCWAREDGHMETVLNKY